MTSTQTSIASFSEFERSSQTSFTHNVLPILDHLSQLYLPFQYFEFIQVIFCIIQFFQTSFWSPYGKYMKSSDVTSTFHNIAFFLSNNIKTKENIIVFGILFSIVFIITVMFILLIVTYNRSRRINKPLLYTIRFYFLFFGAVIIHPFAALNGHLFRAVINEHETRDIFLLLFSFIGFLLSIILFYLNQNFVNQSIYIHKSIWATFDSKIIMFLFMWNPFFVILSNAFQYYPNWTYIFLSLFHISLIILLFINYTWMPFIINFGNSVSLAIVSSILFNDVFRLIIEEFWFVKVEIFITICYLMFFVLVVIFYFVLKFVRKRINMHLSYSTIMSDDEDQNETMVAKNFTPTLEEKYNHFTELKLNCNLNKAMIYLIVGFTSGSEMFTDFSLVQFCIDNYINSPQMIILLIRLLSYFKSEKNRFELVMKQFRSLRESSYFDRFIYNQAHKIMILRQSTSSNASSTRLSDLKLQSNNLEKQMKNFWALSESCLNDLNILEQQQRNLNNLWDESIEDNWTSVMFREEHIRFLIESCTDFQRAVQMTSIKDKIETLRDERDDLCFLSLLHCFPQYINNKIVDKEGNFLNKKSVKEGSSSSMSNHNEKVSTASNEYDFTLEEQIANTILSYGRLRLSMQNALNQVRPNMHKMFVIYTVISILFSLILVIVTFSIFLNLFDSFNDWNDEVGVLTELRIAFSKSLLSLSIVFGHASNRFNLQTVDCNTSYDPNHLFLDRSIRFDDLALYYVNEARNQLSNLMETILKLSVQRVDLSTLTNLFFEPSINSTICYFGLIFDYQNWSMEQAMNFEILSFSVLATDDENIEHWYYNNTYWCHDVATIPQVEDMFTVIQNALAEDLFNISEKNTKTTLIQMYVIGPVFFVIFIIPLPIIFAFYRKEINNLIRMMLMTDQEFKEQARKSISLITINDNLEAIPPVMKKSINVKLIIAFFLLVFIFFIFTVFEELIFYWSKETNEKLRNYGYWSGHFSLLRAYLVEMLNQLINAIYYVDYPQSLITNATYKRRIYKITKAFEGVIYELLNETPNAPSVLETDTFIDKIISLAYCESKEYSTSLHDVYECGSLNRLLSTIHSMFEKATEEIQTDNGVFQGEFLANLYHVIFAHAITMIRDSKDRLTSLQKDVIGSYQTSIFVFFLCAVVFIAVWGALLFFVINSFRRIFNMSICLIRRLSPVGLINNDELTNHLLYKKGEEIEMSVTHKIFNNSFDGIICLNLEGIVEIINKSFAADYGYSPEQLVGQMIGTIFDNESRTKLENQLKLIKNHESSGYYTEHMMCFTNDGRAVPSFVTLIGLKETENSLILIVRDETILLQKKKKLELAKKKSQDLLEQIMPPKVLSMLKEGKSEISFAVPSATVMFVNIVNFSGFSSELSPQQIMGTLSTLFGAFDVWIQKFPLMTKIKLIGDSYMAACGLFAADDEPKNHAKQSVDFALRVLGILDDANIKLNVSLQIRIGINSGGPIIAGVLGTENRVFDIIGDTINVASRLEHKAEAGHIMMSEKTCELVSEFGYNIVPKGEVFLKGKGNMQAYSI